ncbi:MAG: ion channel [Gammaproteobacteria bacterium]
MVTFTSVGYGDVLLTGSWRILASKHTANGVIIFGWTTALILYHTQTVYAEVLQRPIRISSDRLLFEITSCKI